MPIQPFIVDAEVQTLHFDLKRATPAVQWQEVDVTFGSANADYDIQHTLTPSDPENVRYLVVSADRATSLYHDQSGTRRSWVSGLITLRSSVASAAVKLLLYVPRG